jgi:penicillin amidase
MARSGHGVATMQAAQLDVFSPAIARLKQLMIAAAREAGSSDAAVLDRLAAWDAWMQADKPEPLIFIAWLRESVRAIWRDDLGSAFGPAFAPNAPALIRLLEGRAKGRDWCEDRSTPGHQTCGSVLAHALKAALEELTRTYGVNQMHWNWGPAHFAYGEHQPFGTTAILRSFFNVEVPSPGGPYTLNRGAVDFRDAFPFANRHAASCRIIYDLSNLDGSFYISSTGQSGNPFSRLYRSFSDRWARGGYIRIPTARAEIDAGAVGVWHLLPP